jgi:type III restriction enzyme
MAKIDKLIINSAFREPLHHWKYDMQKQAFERSPGRRPAGYFVAGQGSNAYNDIGQFIELPLVNKIRPRVKAWREGGYSGVTGVTKKLLDHWNNKDERMNPFFWCQTDAMETLIWLTEAPAAERVGINIPGDGGGVSAYLHQALHGRRQDYRNGYAYRLAGVQQSGVPAG